MSINARPRLITVSLPMVWDQDPAWPTFDSDEEAIRWFIGRHGCHVTEIVNTPNDYEVTIKGYAPAIKDIWKAYDPDCNMFSSFVEWIAAYCVPDTMWD